MPIIIGSIREPLPAGCARAQIQADGTVLCYMPGDTLPADPVPSVAEVLAQAAAALAVQIDSDVNAVYAQVIGQRATEYAEAEAQATAYAAAGYTGTVPDYVASWATAAGLSAQAATDSILAAAARLRQAAAAMRAARLWHKEKARAAATLAALDAVRASWAATLGQIRGSLGI